jgi:hypothetical protein
MFVSQQQQSTTVRSALKRIYYTSPSTPTLLDFLTNAQKMATPHKHETSSTPNSIFLDMHYKCSNCDVAPSSALLRCSRCKLAWYCTRSCQRSEWKEHKLACETVVIVNNVSATLPLPADMTLQVK